MGRGLEIGGAGIHLSEASRARVQALVDYIEANQATFSSRRARVVFSGGWGAAAAGIAAPPREFREATLMLQLACTLGVNGSDFPVYAEPCAEFESDSTLENILRTKEAGYFDNDLFTVDNPLGIVAHEAHQARIDYYVHRIFGLSGDELLHITAQGADRPSGRVPEHVILFLTRLVFAGAHGHSSLRRRQRLILAGSSVLHGLLRA